MTLWSTFVRSESKVTWVFSKNNLVNDDVSELNSYYSWMLRNKNAHKYWHSWKTRKYVAWQKIWTCTIWTKEIELILPFWFLLKKLEHFETKGVFTCSILASIVTILGKYCGNSYKYWPNTWKMCSPACVILTSIGTILVSFWRNLKRISVIINFRG